MTLKIVLKEMLKKSSLYCPGLFHSWLDAEAAPAGSYSLVVGFSVEAKMDCEMAAGEVAKWQEMVQDLTAFSPLFQ